MPAIKKKTTKSPIPTQKNRVGWRNLQIISITKDNKEQHYLYFPQGNGIVLLQKIGARSTGIIYCVNPNAGTCTCPGYEKGKSCKHVSALRQLISNSQ